MKFVPYPLRRAYTERPHRSSLAAQFEIALRGLTPIAVHPGSYHRIAFPCGHEATYSLSHIKSDRLECPTCRHARRFGDPQ